MQRLQCKDCKKIIPDNGAFYVKDDNNKWGTVFQCKKCYELENVVSAKFIEENLYGCRVSSTHYTKESVTYLINKERLKKWNHENSQQQNQSEKPGDTEITAKGYEGV